MRIRFLFLYAVVALQSFSFAAADESHTISGTVRDTGGNPLAGATVVIKGTFKGTVTDAAGIFKIENVREGDVKLIFSFIGYETKVSDLTVKSDTVVNVILVQTSVMTDDVVISATRAGSNAPLAYSNVDKTILEKLGTASDMPYLLTLTPSFVETSEAGNGVGYTGMRIRGTDASRINVTIDGIPLNDPESQQVFWVDLPDLSSSVDNIQVQRGVGTSTNGAGAFGASINIQTRGIENEPFAGISSAAGSFGTFKNSITAGTGLLKDKFAFQMRFSDIKSDGYIRRTGSDHQSAFLSGLYRSGKSLIKANIILGREHTGIGWWGVPEDILKTDRRYNPAGEYTDNQGITRYYDNESDNYSQDHYQLIFSRKLTDDLSFHTALHYTRGKGYYEEYKEDEPYADYGLGNVRISDSTLYATDLIRRKWMANDFYGIVYSLKYNNEQVEASLGGGINTYAGDHFGRIIWMQYPGSTERDHQWYLNNGEKREAGMYGKMTATISPVVSLFGDLQYRYINYILEGNDDDLKRIGQSHTFSFFNPKTGMYFTIGEGNEAYVSFAVAHREPTRTDFKEASGDNQATPGAERLFDTEIGYRLKLSKSYFTVNLYGMFYKDQLVPTGELSNVGYPIMTNVDKSYRAGAELSAGFAPAEMLAWNFNLTLSRNKIRNFVEYYIDYNTAYWSSEYKNKNLGTVDIAYSPRITGTSDIALKPFSAVDIHLITKYVGKQYFDNTMSSRRMLDPYLVNNVIIGITPVLRNIRKVEIQAIVNNIFNAEYENNAYGGNWYEDGSEKTWAYYFPQAGINFMFKLGFTF
jgi:iron complex outermembrane receptor protein